MANMTGKTLSMLWHIQSLVFEESGRRGLDSEKFIEAYMQSEVAAGMDYPTYKGLWCGKRYLPSKVSREKNIPRGTTWSETMLDWIGFAYRLWALKTRLSSRELYSIADANRMRQLFFRYHTENPFEALALAMEEKNMDVDKYLKGCR